MRKRVRIVLLAALLAAIIVPVGFALSLESEHRIASTPGGVEPVSQVLVSRSIALTDASAVASFPEIPEGAKLFGIGTALFGLAAAMRRGSRSSS